MLLSILETLKISFKGNFEKGIYRVKKNKIKQSSPHFTTLFVITQHLALFVCFHFLVASLSPSLPLSPLLSLSPSLVCILFSLFSEAFPPSLSFCPVYLLPFCLFLTRPPPFLISSLFLVFHPVTLRLMLSHPSPLFICFISLLLTLPFHFLSSFPCFLSISLLFNSSPLSPSVRFHLLHLLHLAFCYPPFSHSIKPSLLLSLFILRGVPDPIHSSLFKTADPLSAITLHAPLSLTSPPCVFQPLSHPPPLLFYPLSLSLSLLPLLSRSNLSPEGSD